MKQTLLYVFSIFLESFAVIVPYYFGLYGVDGAFYKMLMAVISVLSFEASKKLLDMAY